MSRKKNIPRKNKESLQKAQKTKSLKLSKAHFEELINKKWKALFEYVDNSSIAAFRIFFGIIVGYDVCTYLFNEGWIFSFWIADIHHFKYWPFEFVHALPGNGMYILFVCMAIFSLLITFGLFYRIAITLFWFSFTYVFLIEETVYLNHFYLVILVSFVLIFIPASKSYSFDALFFKKRSSDITPAWNVWLLRFMIALPYFFGGIAKIKPDWLQGEPLRIWLYDKTDFPIIGSFFRDEWMIYFMSYSGLFLDLLIVPALLFRKTRLLAFGGITLFHLMNSQLFTIAIFPWFMIAATCIYFNPDWFRMSISKLLSSHKTKALRSSQNFNQLTIGALNLKQKVTIVLLCIWLALHCSIPLRHYFIPGNVLWTEEGYYFAWHMMLRDKVGTAVFTMENKQTGERRTIVNEDYLTPFQAKKVFVNPKLTWEFCQKIKEIYAKLGFDIAVYADVKVSLNGRPYTSLVNPDVDITSKPNPIFAPVGWLLPDK
jgi:hypothetical protein